LLAVSPCADALSLDAWWQRRRTGASRCELEPALAYGVPIRIAWLLIATIFFFPGLWKLRVSGLDWIASENFRNQLYWKWYQTPALRPPFRIDRYPRLCVIAAASAIALEVSFPLLILRRASRRLAVVGALGFHAFTALFMGIDFSILWACYPVFFDWHAIAGRLRSRTPLPACASQRNALPSIAMGLVLVAGAVITGWLGITAGWPFACYPTFAHRVPASIPVLQIEVVDASGHVQRIPPEALVEHGDWSRYWGLGWSLANDAGSLASRARIAAWWRDVATRPRVRAMIRGSVRVRFFRAEVPVDPDRRDVTAGARQLIDEIPIE
jgi:hypothetical protein